MVSLSSHEFFCLHYKSKSRCRVLASETRGWEFANHLETGCACFLVRKFHAELDSKEVEKCFSFTFNWSASSCKQAALLRLGTEHFDRRIPKREAKVGWLSPFDPFRKKANIDDCRRRRLLCDCLIRIFSRIIPSRRFVESYGNKQSSCFAPSVSSPSHLTSFRKTLFGWLFIAVAFRALRKPRKKRKMKINQTETVFARYNFTFQRHDKNCGLPGWMKKKGNKLGMVRLMRRLRGASSMNFNYCNLRAFSQQNLS